MANSNKTVAELRDYNVLTVEDARSIATIWLERTGLEEAIVFGLPEIDDRYHIWRVPLVGKDQRERVGEIAIDARTSLVYADKTTSKDILEKRLLRRKDSRKKRREIDGTESQL